MKRRAVAGIVLAVFVAGLVIWCLQITPADVIEAARRHGVEKGWQAEDLVVQDYHTTGNLFGSKATVEFQVKGSKPPKKVVVELRRPGYSRTWQVEEFREEAHR
jgi:hypothetical protein